MSVTGHLQHERERSRPASTGRRTTTPSACSTADGEPIERFTVPHTKTGLARLNTILDRHHVDDVGIERA